MRKNKIISQHLLKLKEKTWELQIIHISTKNLMMHSYCYSEKEGTHKISFVKEMKAHNFQLPIIWRHATWVQAGVVKKFCLALSLVHVYFSKNLGYPAGAEF